MSGDVIKRWLKISPELNVLQSKHLAMIFEKTDKEE